MLLLSNYHNINYFLFYFVRNSICKRIAMILNRIFTSEGYKAVLVHHFTPFKDKKMPFCDR